MLGIDDEKAFEIEEITDAAAGPEVAAGQLEQPAQLAGGSVAVVGQGLAKDGHAAGAIPFVDHFFKVLGAELAGRLLDRSLDILLGDAERARLIDRVAQSHVGGGIAAAVASRHVDRAAQLGEKLRSLGVDQPFPMGDVG